jgi:hypothetical protein
MSSTVRWRNGLIVRLVIETASLVEVDTSIFRKAFAGPLRRSHRRPIMLDPGRAPHQSIAERFSALAMGCLLKRTRERPQCDRKPDALKLTLERLGTSRWAVGSCVWQVVYKAAA